MMERSHRRLEERMVELQRAAEAIVRERAGGGEAEQVDAVLAFLERSAARRVNGLAKGFMRYRKENPQITQINTDRVR